MPGNCKSMKKLTIIFIANSFSYLRKHIIILALFSLIFSACEDDDGIMVNTTDFSMAIGENPNPGQILGSIAATTNKGSVVFSLSSQNPDGALLINGITGELLVLDHCLFDFEINPVITGIVLVINQDVTASSNVTITLHDIYEGVIWTGSKIVFTKPNFADISLPKNQDRITDNVWITRADFQGIFNIKSEPAGYLHFFSPADTEWVFGTTADLCNLVFESWEDTIESVPIVISNKNMVVHLITDNIYIDIKFLTWQCCGQGGGFSYERSTQ